MGTMGWVLYFVFIIGLMYFIAIRPQQKEKKKMQELMSGVSVGDSVLTSSGFYGVIIDMTDDTVIVEFGSNKNCRIPMRKDAIVQVEKPEL
ncbi:preprotein translocase subunit YajC [uncultured Clostridium sp.]|uniref:preprotein translocase subunit YajC n=1 Tax=uncultured Clostridium sp. TaxID=59620 RepID=UPI0025E93B0F|nr:preprotein translocase subunit YajC [uncultured Clostridium sp.]